jgi:ABC-type bacteriocin/lantibiotic exporter with double-glycine peptidase domain
MDYDSENINSYEEYIKPYRDHKDLGDTDTEIIKDALKNALDIRKFEIGLYWKRTGYFWVFISAVFVAYYQIITNSCLPPGKREKFAIILSALGVFLSCCWFCVNKASKYWQENWEKHVDLLEDAVIGPLYKTTLQYEHHNPWSVLSADTFSVSKINQLMSFATVLVWVYIFIDEIFTTIKLSIPSQQYYIPVIVIVLIVFMYILFNKCRSAKINGGAHFSMSRRISE